MAIHYASVKYNSYGDKAGILIACGVIKGKVLSSTEYTGNVSCKRCKKTWVFRSDNYV